jgi:cell wall assembly regulator SMI1
MNIIQSNPYGPLDEERLREFERTIGHTLPEDYREFLLEHNGPVVSPLSFKIGVGEGGYEDSIEDGFFGLHDGHGPSYRTRYLDNPSRFPDGVIPIAHDGMGNYVCIGLSGGERSRILYFNHERNGGDDLPEDLEPLADSLSEFLDSLFEGDDRYDDDEDF